MCKGFATIFIAITFIALMGCQQLTQTDATPSVQFTCKNGQNFSVKFNNDTKEAIIHYQDKTIVLPQQMSGSGFRYANNTQEIRGKGRNLTATINPPQQIQCVAYP